jgi:hypothetical protein
MDTIENRETYAAEALVRPDCSATGLRPLSAGSLALLQLLKNPLADRFFTGTAADFDAYHVIEYAWVHSLPPDEVRHAVAVGSAREQILAWAEAQPPSLPVQVVQEIAAEVKRVVALLARVVPDPKAPASKNAQTPRT